MFTTVIRFDDQPLINGRWNNSTEGTAAFAPGARERAQFTRNASTASRVIVGLTDFRGTRHEYSFRLTGLSSALRGLGCVDVESSSP